MKKLLISGVIAVGLFVGVSSASAVTVAELKALGFTDAQATMLIALFAPATSAPAATTFSSDLTLGSTGGEVVALQDFLISKGYLNMPAGVAKGYFGNLTKSALAAYQMANGISPASGYFGPITRGKVNAAVVVVTPVTPVTPTTPSTPSTPDGISTVGSEGTISVTQTNAGLPSTVYEGDEEVAVLGFKVEAKDSDVDVQRVKLDLGTATTIYNKIYSKVYLFAGSEELASSNLSSSVVTKSGSHYYVTLSGFHKVIKMDDTEVFTVKVDVRPSIDSTLIDTETYSIALPANAIRAVDGAGIDIYEGTSSITRAQNVDGDLIDSAALKISLNSATPKATDVVAADGSADNELDKVTTLTFDVKAEKDDVTITAITVGVTDGNAGGAATAETAYLYDGSSELDSASISSDSATFTDSNGIITIPKDTTKTLTIKVDIRNADAARETFVTAITTDPTAENSAGDSLAAADITGTATGNTIGVRNVGPEIKLVSRTAVTDGAPQTSGSNNIATSSLTATFVVEVKAVGGALTFGDAGSTTPMFTSTDSFSFDVYRNGAAAPSVSSFATSTSFAAPSGVTVDTVNHEFTLADGATMTIPVTFKILGRSATAPLTDGLYSIGLSGVNWANASDVPYTTTFMAGDTDWMTPSVAFP